jgi:hypothetical protein
LLTSVGLRWLVLIDPARLTATPWLQGHIGRLLQDDRLTLLARTTGIDVRRSAELALAGYRDGVVAYLVRHQSDQTLVERRFRERLTSAIERAEHGHQLTGLWGNIGTKPHGFAALGPDVAVYQYGGDRKRGAARIALLYAEGKLARVPSALGEASMAALQRALGNAPAMVLLPGPFEGDAARGVRGLLGAATAFGAALTPTKAKTLQLRVLLVGSFSLPADKQGDSPLDYLRAAWTDLAQADLGRLLRLHETHSNVYVSTRQLGPDLTELSLGVELSAPKLFEGLAAATIDDVRDMMRAP